MMRLSRVRSLRCMARRMRVETSILENMSVAEMVWNWWRGAYIVLCGGVHVGKTAPKGQAFMD